MTRLYYVVTGSLVFLMLVGVWMLAGLALDAYRANQLAQMAAHGVAITAALWFVTRVLTELFATVRTTSRATGARDA